jgi:hypothetical protein
MPHNSISEAMMLGIGRYLFRFISQFYQYVPVAGLVYFTPTSQVFAPQFLQIGVCSLFDPAAMLFHRLVYGPFFSH